MSPSAIPAGQQQGDTLMPASCRFIRPVLTPYGGSGRGEPFSLDAFLPDLRALRPGEVACIMGPPGSGKSVTINLLRHALPEHIRVLDEDDGERQAAREAVVEGGAACIYARTMPLRLVHKFIFRLEPWRMDQWLDYLLANHREQCRSVMPRLTRVTDAHRLAGNPELWSKVLDLMASDDVLGPVETLRRSVLTDSNVWDAAARERHPILHAMHAVEAIVRDVCAGKSDALPQEPDPQLHAELVAAACAPAFADKLAMLLEDYTLPSHALPLMLLHGASHEGTAWRPTTHVSLKLDNAVLIGLTWHGVDIPSLTAEDADLTEADLSGSTISQAHLRRANLSRACLASARWNAPDLARSCLERADLSDARIDFANFENARAAGLLAERADLSYARFVDTDCTSARFVRANLAFAWFHRAVLDDADFSAALLNPASFHTCDLRTALFHGARLSGATLRECRLDGQNVEALDIELAQLTKCDLSGATLRNLNARDATFRSCGLADVDWESATLFNADLRGCTFHAGTTRSGLVFSPIACEGSKTGFYTDDFNDRTHMAPEEIRKANLCFADLRGAQIDNVDFYLVDLRRAQYTNEQAQWFKRCGAILYDKRA